MSVQVALFYLLSTVIILSALRVITNRNPIHAVLFLVLTFFASMGLWLMLQAEFLAIVLLLVYVGAVMVFFLFVIMMLDFNIEKKRPAFWHYALWAGFIALMMAITLVFILSGATSLPMYGLSLDASHSNTQALGLQIYTYYFLPFELAGMLLVLAMVAAIALTWHHKAPSRANNPTQQINIIRKKRIRLVNLRTTASPQKKRARR